MIGPDDFRRVLGHFASGVTVVTTRDSAGRPAGLTASAFTSVSLTPPMILVCVAHNAQSYEALRASDRFAVNILAGVLNDASGAGAANAAGYDGMLWLFGSLSLAAFISALLLQLRRNARSQTP